MIEYQYFKLISIFISVPEIASLSVKRSLNQQKKETKKCFKFGYKELQ